MVCYICLQHNDHNVVSSSLETHEIILKYSNLFDFDQLLISTQIGSIEEIHVNITYLLSLCEHGDLHLRGACASLLATLIQTTIHLLLNNVHLYQLIHKTVQGIKLLEDSIQHTTSSCILAKVSLAQLMDDIDFRILTYLEQQLKQQYPDIRAAILDLHVQLLLIRHFIYCIAEFLVMLSHDTLHSKQVIKIQDLIKHYDSLLASGHEPETHALTALEPVLYDFFSFIVNSVQIEDDKWERLSRQIVDLLLAHLQSQNDVLSSVNETRDETFSATLLRVLHDVILRILTNT
ncbi:unnamed protein product [Rotaria sp. Silwood1]|nr:unnamed protein product [Rotaria sp. Silwood1]CAF1132441.1 unnamed protein product [Rotaria sp. Silwood1]